MANTYTLISSVEVGAGGAANITFSSIPSTYTDLKLVWSARTSGTNATGIIQFNTDTTTSNYNEIYLLANGTGAGSGNANQPWFFNINQSTDTANTFSNGEMYIPNYTSSNKKSISTDNVLENNATTGYNIIYAGLWQGTAAINQIVMSCYSGNFVQYSTAYLYGIKNS